MISPLKLKQVLGGGGVVFDCNPTHLSASLFFFIPSHSDDTVLPFVSLTEETGESIAARRRLTSVTLHAS